jgi:hypothetical protein
LPVALIWAPTSASAVVSTFAALSSFERLWCWWLSRSWVVAASCSIS